MSQALLHLNNKKRIISIRRKLMHSEMKSVLGKKKTFGASLKFSVVNCKVIEVGVTGFPNVRKSSNTKASPVFKTSNLFQGVSIDFSRSMQIVSEDIQITDSKFHCVSFVISCAIVYLCSCLFLLQTWMTVWHYEVFLVVFIWSILSDMLISLGLFTIFHHWL